MTILSYVILVSMVAEEDTAFGLSPPAGGQKLAGPRESWTRQKLKEDMEPGPEVQESGASLSAQLMPTIYDVVMYDYVKLFWRCACGPADMNIKTMDFMNPLHEHAAEEWSLGQGYPIGGAEWGLWV